MPPGIVRGREDIIIDFLLLQDLHETLVFAGLLGIGEMHGHLDGALAPRGRLACGPAARVHEPGYGYPVALAGHRRRRLVADLDHPDVDARIERPLEAVL